MQYDEDVQASWVRGVIPWTAAGLAEAFAELPTLTGETPALVEGADPTLPIGQPAAREIIWLIARYGERTGPAHALRLFQVRRFLVAHRGRLAAEELYRQPQSDDIVTDAFVLSPGLTHALAVLPYSSRTVDLVTVEQDVALDVDEVIKAAQDFDQAAAEKNQ